MKKITSNTTTLLLILVIVGILLRVLALNHVFFVDEVAWPIGAEQSTTIVISSPNISHPPLGGALYIISTTIFGYDGFALRIVPLLFGLLTIFLSYLIAVRLYSKKVGLITVGLMGFGFWHIVASTQVDIDGSILAFLFFVTLYCILRYEDTQKRKWIYFAGVFFGLSALTKYTTFLLGVVLLIYFIIRAQSIKEFFNHVIPLFSIAILIFLVFPVYALLLDPSLLLNSLTHASSSVMRIISYKFFIDLLLWGTPLLLGTLIIYFSRIITKYKKHNLSKDLLLRIFLIVILIAYLFFLGPAHGPFERYLMIIIPVVSIFAAYVITIFVNNAKDVKLALCMFLLAFILIYFVNTVPARYIPHNTSQYISEMVTLQWGFNFPYVGSSGPAFWVNFLSIGLVMVVSFLSLFIFLVASLSNLKFAKIFFILFISVSFAFNIFLVHSFLYDTTHPNIDKISHEIISYDEITPLKRPIYINSYHHALTYYLDKKDVYVRPTINGFTANNISADLAINGGTILIIDFPITDKSSLSWNMTSACVLEHVFTDKGVAVAYLFICDKQ